MTQLLPPNSTSVERAVEAAGGERLDALRAAVRSRWNPQTCPAEWLGLLAWALSVDTWRSEWPEATKRAVIAASPRVHRLKGTVAAVRAAASAVAGRLPTRVVEWFQPGGSAVPFTADIEVDVTNAGAAIDANLPRDIIAAVNAAKNTRSRVGVRLAATLPAASITAALIRRPLTIARLDLSGDLRPQLAAASVSAALLRRPLVIATLRGSVA